MHSRVRHRRHALLSIAILVACSTDAVLGPPADLVLSTPFDFSARVSQIDFEGGNSPNGPYSQYDAWVIVPPGASANAGVVIPTNAPVFVRHNGQIFSSRVTNVKAGDLVEVWHDKTVGYGAAQAPPGAPVYAATQIVIDQ